MGQYRFKKGRLQIKILKAPFLDIKATFMTDPIVWHPRYHFAH